MRSRFIALGAAAALSLTVSAARAEVVEVTETRTIQGTVSQITPSSQIVIQSGAGAPTTYTVSKNTTYVDANGNVISYEQVRGHPVQIYVAPDQPKVVERVVVTEPVKQVIEERTVEHPQIEHRIEQQVAPGTTTRTHTESRTETTE